MKTVNFLQAYELNDKMRVRPVYEKNGWYDVKALHNKKIAWGISAIKSDWEVEPEKIEFECGWMAHDYKTMPTIPKPYFDLSSLIGRKTKVTIEVID